MSNGISLKTLFLGTSEFAVPSFRVTASRTQLCGVLTQPDRPAGRGHKLRATPVKTAAVELGIPVFEPRSLREFAAQHADEGYDLFVLASYGRILPQLLLDIPKFGSFNVHPSLLPKYRGATPIQTALLNGEPETGVTIMLMDAGMDTGDVVLQERTPIDDDERYGELHDRLAAFGAQALSHALDLARSGHIPHYPQNGTPTLTKPLRKEDLLIDWSWPAQRIVNAVRAFAPSPGARANVQGVQVKILRARAGTASIAPVAAGTIVGTNGDAVTVRCGDGTVDVLELVPPNRAAQSGSAFAR
ncbi:MAG TPA: methionyl-tRNA formyltransferase [Candidatus Baltobacteraceae bacterium]|nr:methionyl-tRNA formyltransferase [Candidatus Baltobacteraceae bacterium]